MLDFTSAVTGGRNVIRACTLPLIEGAWKSFTGIGVRRKVIAGYKSDLANMAK